ncbi:MAG: cupin domain-containing protein [Candidatus Dormibacter sp.]|uniref:cupin domain-containing protein n=1 Tax=Candidatus Dormibacter sp. TaxID=2973982 RepID=UPI000DB4A50F|nr:MAG: hypothetical protein DLM66_02585 [Candidatus Dormibacteraeota bacterium]
MTLSEPFVVEPGPRTGPFKVLAGGDRTGGQALFGDAKMGPKVPGPPRHVHKNEDEAIYVIEGTLTFDVDGRRFEAGPGAFVWMPRERPHSFSNLSTTPAWAFGVFLPPDVERFFEEQEQYFASLAGPPDEDVLGAMAAKYGITFLGPPLSA